MSGIVGATVTDGAGMAGGADGATLTQRAYGLLREDILSGELSAGSKLRIEALKSRYGIGPTPLREALSRLAAEGFVASEENRGFRIPPMSLEEIRDITDQRKLIECAALRTAIERADEDFEARVLAAYYKLSRVDERLAEEGVSALLDWEGRHRAYHRALIEGAHSPLLSKFQETLYDQADRYRRQYLLKGMFPPSVRRDHKAILDATLDRDADRACSLLSDHIERVFDVASRSFRAPAEG